MLKHVDDDGDLSVFANGRTLVFVCDKGGHYWTVDAAEQDSLESNPKKLQHIVGADMAKYMKELAE
jgi:hypothetical protein